ncbi:MAG: c-type cytochrome [Alphaproteobacteria bacterium]|nr:c-type cytochrome [Alphaproteobacteria bacterium]
MCGSCHVPDAPRNLAGPHLVGIVGRPAASVAGFAYSPALKAAGFAWTAEKLDAFLANPRATVPGTAMVIAVAKPEDRASIIAYLRSLGAPPGQ